MTAAKELVDRLHRVRAILRRTVVEASVSRVVAVAVPVILVAALIDFTLRIPAGVRALMLVAAIGWLVLAWRRRLWPALRFRPSLVDVALRIEATSPPLAGRLASGVDFVQSGAADRSPLAERAIREVAVRMGAVRFETIARTAPAHRMLGLALAAVALCCGAAAWRPDDASIAARRLLLPFGDARWPARTEVVSALDPALVHPKGEPLALAADLLKGDPESTRVSVRMRRVRDGVAESWRSLVLTPQSSGRFERVVETDADLIEYVFLTDDWESVAGEVRIVPAPAVASSRIVIDPPTYASRRSLVEAVLGPGTDRRARVGRAVLEGSTATLQLELERAVPITRLDDGTVDPAFTAAILRTPRGSESVPTLAVDPTEPTRWTIDWTLDRGGDLALDLEDEHGLRNLEPIRFRVDTVPDRAPSTTITTPASDRLVTPSAVVALQAEARDDVGLASFSIEASVRRGGVVSSSGAVAQVGDADFEIENGLIETTIRHELDVASLSVEVGDDVELVAIATDERPRSSGASDGVSEAASSELFEGAAEPVRSAVRRLRVVAESVLIEELQGALVAVRRDALRMDEDQARLEDEVRRDGAGRPQVREQGRLGDRVSAAREAIESIQDRSAENRIEDGILQEVVDQAAGLLDAAQRASDRAVAALDRATEAREREADAERNGETSAAGDAAQQAADAEREATEAQDEVRDELADLAATLDRGEDAWVVSRRIEQLAEDLAALQARTADLAERTMGREREDLDADTRSDLDEVARAQSELADRAEELVDELDRRADAMEQADPVESQGLRDAAREARREGLEERMREAEQGARENRLQQAGAAQQQAAEALERMQETIEEARKARVEELRRRMESLVQSLEALVTASEDEVIALAGVEGPDDRAALDDRVASLIRLQRNTLAVAAEAASAEERIGRIVSRAAGHQAAAIGDLRGAPADLEAARDAEERGLASLREALALAEQAAEDLAQQQADAERARLVAAYRVVLETQAGIRVETERIVPAEGERLDRRGLVTARRLATDEESVGEAVRSIREEFTAVDDSLVFSLTHRQLEGWITDAAARLRDGRPDAITIARETMILEAIGGLVEALDREQQPPDDPFGEQQAGGGGGGEGGQQGDQPQPLIPPIAELKMLRTMQIQILEATRRLEASGAVGAERETGLAELARMQSDLHGVGTALLNTLEPQPVGPAPTVKDGGPGSDGDQR